MPTYCVCVCVLFYIYILKFFPLIMSSSLHFISNNSGLVRSSYICGLSPAEAGGSVTSVIPAVCCPREASVSPQGRIFRNETSNYLSENYKTSVFSRYWLVNKYQFFNSRLPLKLPNFSIILFRYFLLKTPIFLPHSLQNIHPPPGPRCVNDKCHSPDLGDKN